MDSCLEIIYMIIWECSHPNDIHNLTSVCRVDTAQQYFLTRLKPAISNTGKIALTEHLLLVADCLSAIGEFVALNGGPYLKGHKSLDISKMIRSFFQTRARSRKWFV